MKRLILITGEKNSGKTTFLTYFLENVARKKGYLPGGFLAEGIYRAGIKTGFDLVDLNNGHKKMLCTDIPKKGWIQMGRFFFDPEGFRFGETLLTQLQKNACPVVVDEFGPLELSGKGWRHAIDRLLSREDLVLMMTVRKEILDGVINVFSGNELHVFNVNRSAPAILAEEITKLLPS